jgi:hypothetical protein
MVHSRPESLYLHAWLLSGRDYVRKAFLKEQQAEWRKGVGEHSVPRERHGVYCEGQRVWNWRYKGFQFVIQTGSKEIYMRSNLLHQPGQNKHGFQNFCFCLVPGL